MRVIDHPDGPLDERADCVLAFDVEDDVRELLWARFVRDTLFEVCSVPFFAYDVALGDLVMAPDLRFERVVRASGRYVLRVFFQTVERARAILDEIGAAGCAIEPRGRLVAIDLRSEALCAAVSGRLAEYELEGILKYETGRR